jgi:hypothetical protein
MAATTPDIHSLLSLEQSATP